MLTHNARFEGWFDPLLLQQDPVDLLEERMNLDGLLQALGDHTAQTLVWTLRHELQDRETGRWMKGEGK